MYTFIAEEQADPDSPWSIAEMCRVLQVSRSGFYDWQSRPPSNRDVTDRVLAAEIGAIWECSARTYGAPRVHAWLLRQGYRVARKRVARIMREHGWAGVMGRIRVRTTRRDKTAAPAPDLVARAFDPDAPDRIWAGDVTYLRTGQGWLYLATVIDLYSRRVIGWALADHLRADLVCDALTNGRGDPRRRRRRGRVPLRPRLPIHVSEVPSPVCPHRRHAVDGSDRSVLGQQAPPRRSSPPSSASWSTATAGSPARPCAAPSSAGSRGGTTPAGCTPRSPTSRRWREKTATTVHVVPHN
jgi:hypothetical protein